MRVVGFEMLDKLGEGGMATVWKARQVSLDRIVAIKVLSSQFAADPDDVARFQSEAQSAAKLKHPSIVQVYDANMQEGFYYFVMEFVNGYTVGEWMQRSGTLSEKEALLVAECVAEALKHAWEKEGIIHCDIKPDNIMVDEDGTVKVADLGLARTLSVMSGSSEEMSREILGTPSFMSPEQARGEVRLDCRSDMYSLGATLYYLLTGSLLFEGRTDEEIIDLQAEDGTVPDPTTLNPKLSRGACRLIESWLAKDPADRPKDWSAALSDIRRVKRRMIPQHQLKPGRTSTVQPMRKPADMPTNRLRAATAQKPSGSMPWLKWALLGGGLSFVLVLVFLFGRDTKPPPRPTLAWQDEEISAVPASPAAPTSTDADARDMFEFAKSWAEENPESLSEAIVKFQEVARQTRGTRYALLANTEVARLNAARNEAVNKVMAGLEQEAEELVGAHRYREAAALYRRYAGAMADESRERRRQAAQSLENRLREREREEKRRQQEIERRFADALAQAAATLLEEGCGTALTILDEVLSETGPEDTVRVLRRAHAAISDAARVDERILASFRAQVGQDTAVDLLSGRVQVRISSVSPESVQGTEVRRIGSSSVRTPVSFRVAELAPREKLLRMGRDSEPGVPLAKGLLAYESNAMEHARKYFADTPAPLGDALLSAMDALAQTAQEQQAEQALATLLRRVGVEPSGPFDRETWAALVLDRNLSAADIEKLREDIRAFRAMCGETQFAQEAEPFLADMEGLRSTEPDRREREPDDAPAPSVRRQDLSPVRDWTPFQAIADEIADQIPDLDPEQDIQAFADAENRLRWLEMASPELRSFAPFGKLEDLTVLYAGGVPFQGRHRRRPTAPVSNLSLLSSLRLEALYVGQTSVRDLSPLETMPLRELYVGGTQVDDIRALRNMPLEVLDLRRTDVRDLSPLRGMPLRDLNLSEASRVFDFRPLTGLPLRVFDASGTQLRDIGFMKDMPLERLDISDTRVHNFAMLRNLPLRHLNLSSTQIRDISLFRGQRLESLNVRDTGVSSVEVLRGMPLTSLNLAGTQVRDLSPLENVPLTRLDISGCRVDTIAWAARMPLQSLVLAQTAVQDLTPLQDKDLHYLNINNTNVRDLDALRKFSVRRLSIRGVRADLSPLRGLSLRALDLDNPENHMALLRSIKGLRHINGMTMAQLLESMQQERPGRRLPPHRRR